MKCLKTLLPHNAVFGVISLFLISMLFIGCSPKTTYNIPDPVIEKENAPEKADIEPKDEAVAESIIKENVPEKADKDEVDVSNVKDKKAPPDAHMTNPVYDRPYTIRGITYWRLKSVGKYTQTGIASWYGREEHGLPTASGEKFNMYDVTAAHKALPLGTVVMVLNLENGRYTTVRINDRGPHIPGRIIDMTYKGAKALGIVDTGTANVRIVKVNNLRPGKNGRMSMKKTAEIEAKLSKGFGFGAVIFENAEKKPDVQNIEKPVVKTDDNFKNTQVAEIGTQYAVQIGSFSDPDYAESAAVEFGTSRVVRVKIKGKDYYRVQVTGFKTKYEAEKFVKKEASRFPGAFVMEVR